MCLDATFAQEVKTKHQRTVGLPLAHGHSSKEIGRYQHEHYNGILYEHYSWYGCYNWITLLLEMKRRDEGHSRSLGPSGLLHSWMVLDYDTTFTKPWVLLWITIELFPS